MSLFPGKAGKPSIFPYDSTGIHLCGPSSEPDATRFSEVEQAPMETSPSQFAADFVLEHSSMTKPIRSGDDSIHISTRMPRPSKSAQA